MRNRGDEITKVTSVAKLMVQGWIIRLGMTCTSADDKRAELSCLKFYQNTYI